MPPRENFRGLFFPVEESNTFLEIKDFLLWRQKRIKDTEIVLQVRMDGLMNCPCDRVQYQY